MKKFLFSIAVFLFAFQLSHAQTEKGTQTLGGEVGFNYYKTNDFTVNPADNSSATLNTKTTGFKIGPDYSYFVADKLDIGINVSYSSSTTSNSTTNVQSYYYPPKASSYNFNSEIFIRKYYMYHDKIGFRTGAYLDYSRVNSTTIYDQSSNISNDKSTSNNYSGGVLLDLVYYPAKKFGLSAAIANLEYNHTKIDDGTSGHINGDSVSFNFMNSFLLSIFYVIGK